MKKFLKIFFPSIFILLSFFVFPHSVSALGMSPPALYIDSVLRGTSSVHTIGLQRMFGEKGDLQIKTNVYGDGASSIILDSSFVIPADTTILTVPFTIDATHAPDGEHSAFLAFILTPDVADTATGEGTGSAVLSGVTFSLRFTVSGNQVIGYTFDILSTFDAESDTHPFLTFTITNTGNVDWRPEKISGTFTDQNDATHVVPFSFSGELFSYISPGERSQQTIEIPQFLPEGSYTVAVNFLEKDLVVGALSASELAILAPGSLKQNGDLISVSAKKDSFPLGEKIPLDGVLKNTGEVPITAILFTEIYKDGAYVDLIRGDEAVVGIGETSHISQIIDVQEKGKYTLTSYAKYANKKTPPKDVHVVVNSGNVVLDFVNSPLGLGIVVFFIILIAVLVILKRRKSRVSVPVVPAPVVATPVLPRVEEHLVPPGSSGAERSQ